MTPPLDVTVVGCGLVGSYFLPLLAGVASRITLVDPDWYEPANLSAQNVDAVHVGQPKVTAQAERLLRMNPGLRVEPIQNLVADVPLGRLRGGVIVAAVDSRSARQDVNEAAWRLGIQWIDIGVLGGAFSLARVNLYNPAAEGCPCLECLWSEREYSELEVDYPCLASGRAARPTLAPAALGSLAASLAGMEVLRLLSGGALEGGRQIVYDAAHQAAVVSRNRRNPGCRFDHAQWEIDGWECGLEITTAGEAARELGGFSVPGHSFVEVQVCPACGRREEALRLNRPVARCRDCRLQMTVAQSGFHAELNGNVPQSLAARTLAQLGLRHGDVLAAGDGTRRMIVQRAA